jgi:hypothetical protein
MLFKSGMKSPIRASLFAALVLTTGLSLLTAHAEKDGPFPISLSSVDHMAYTFYRKLEAPTQAINLARYAPDGITQLDGIVTLLNKVTIQTQTLDPVTNATVITTVTYPAGTRLNPTVNPEDNILIPVGVMVTTHSVANGDFPFGRFAYLGVVPRFESANLEMVASKMGHTLRVKAWVTPDILDSYEFTLLSKFKSYHDMIMSDTIHLEPLRDLKKIAADAPTAELKKWYTVASYYGKHLYENSKLDIYRSDLPELDYKRMILTLMIQTYLDNPEATIESGLALYEQYQADPTFLLKRREDSARLFRAHFKGNFQEGPVASPVSELAPLDDPTNVSESAAPDASLAAHADAVGYMNFVYPIAIDKNGPFKSPRPGLRKFPLSNSFEGRWWSNQWNAEYGGFPVLQVTSDGVAFHGPITMSSDGMTGFLHRDDVSHSCLRMDSSDVMELRALIPRNMNELQGLGHTIPLRIIEWPDVTDLDNNGTSEVVDVAYYSIPSSGAGINNPRNWRPEVYNENYWENTFGPYVGMLPSNNNLRITKIGKKNGAVLTGLPKYDVVDGQLKVVGYYGETPVMTVPEGPNRIIQYREAGVRYSNADRSGEDRWGAYPPKVVNKF